MDTKDKKNKDFTYAKFNADAPYRLLKDRFPEDMAGDLADLVKEEIVGQDEAVKQICSFLVIQLCKLNYNRRHKGDSFFQEVPLKSLMITGPSGCGKTATVECICRNMEIPVSRIDASSKVPTGFKGQSWLTVISDAVSQMQSVYPDEPVDRLVEQFNMGSVVILDEFDKAIEPVKGTDISNYHTLSQGSLLKLLEGGTYSTEELGITCECHPTITTKNTIFVLAGSFSALDDAVREGMGKEIRMARNKELAALDARLADFSAGRENERAAQEKKCLELRNRILKAESSIAACRLEADKALMGDRDRLAELENRAGLIHCELVDRSRLLTDLGREGGETRPIGFTCVDSMAGPEPERERDTRGRVEKEHRLCQSRGRELDELQTSIDTLRLQISAKEGVYRKRLEKLVLERDELNLALSRATTLQNDRAEEEAALLAQRSRLAASYAARLQEVEKPGNHRVPDMETLICYYELIPEIAGRMADLVVMKPLGEKALAEIAKRSSGTDLGRLSTFFCEQGIYLVIADKARLAMVKAAMKKGLGARGLVSVLSQVIYPSYPLMQAKTPCRVYINEDCITKGTAPVIRSIYPQ